MRSLRVSGLWTASLILLSAPGGADAIVPFDWIHKVSLSVQQGVQEQAWLWGWAWGPDSTVSIVDRSPVLTFPSRPAGFGADLADPMLGYVIPLNSFTAPCEEGLMATDDNTTEWNLGCPPLCVTGANVPSEDERWIALVQRGSCQFANKAREAQRLGAKAVVVGGDDPAVSGNPDVLVNMYSPGDSSDITIAATFIRFSDYALLYALIQASNTSHSGLKTLSMLISSEYSPWQWYSPIVTFVTLLFIPSSLAFLTLLVHRIRAARAAQLDRAPVDIVHSLPWRVWTGSAWEKHGGSPESSSTIDVERGEGTAHAVIDDEEDPAWFLSQVECIICLENFAKGDRVRVLPCKHIFHLKEVDEWLIQRKKLCPICKADVTKPTPHAHAANQPPPTTTTATTDSDPTPQIQSPDLPAASSATERTPLLPPRPNPEP